MVRQYYQDQITDFSENQLKDVFQTVKSPACLLGGWAVHFHVSNSFQEEHNRTYIGSRDIDLGIHVNPDWTAEELQDSLGQTITAIEDLGYSRSRFGFVQNFHRDTRKRITEEKAQEYSLHEVFQVYIDLIPDTTELSTFEDVFGFKPPAEPLLEPAFQNESTPLSNHVTWNVPETVRIPEADLLAAMKIRSLPDRDKGHKQVKDLADLHALLWYATDISEIKNQVLEHISSRDIDNLEDSVDDSLVDDAANLLQINADLIDASINRLRI